MDKSQVATTSQYDKLIESQLRDLDLGKMTKELREDLGKMTTNEIRIDIEECRALMQGDSTTMQQKLQKYKKEYIKGKDGYVGEWNDDGLKHGKGKMTYVSGNVYDGEWKRGQRHGEGVMRYNDGRMFHGEWHNNEWSKGVLSYPNKDTWDGNWKQTMYKTKSVKKKHGDMTCRFNDNSVAVMKYVDDHPSGEAIYTNKTGTVYVDCRYDKKKDRNIFVVRDGVLEDGSRITWDEKTKTNDTIIGIYLEFVDKMETFRVCIKNNGTDTFFKVGRYTTSQMVIEAYMKKHKIKSGKKKTMILGHSTMTGTKLLINSRKPYLKDYSIKHGDILYVDDDAHDLMDTLKLCRVSCAAIKIQSLFRGFASRHREEWDDKFYLTTAIKIEEELKKFIKYVPFDVKNAEMEKHKQAEAIKANKRKLFKEKREEARNILEPRNVETWKAPTVQAQTVQAQSPTVNGNTFTPQQERKMKRDMSSVVKLPSPKKIPKGQQARKRVADKTRPKTQSHPRNGTKGALTKRRSKHTKSKQARNTGYVLSDANIQASKAQVSRGYVLKNVSRPSLGTKIIRKDMDVFLWDVHKNQCRNKEEFYEYLLGTNEPEILVCCGAKHIKQWLIEIQRRSRAHALFLANMKKGNREMVVREVQFEEKKSMEDGYMFVEFKNLHKS